MQILAFTSDNLHLQSPEITKKSIYFICHMSISKHKRSSEKPRFLNSCTLIQGLQGKDMSTMTLWQKCRLTDCF